MKPNGVPELIQKPRDAARQAFNLLNARRQKGKVWVVAPSNGTPGKLMDNLLPTFWSQELSRIFAQARPPKPDASDRGANPSGRPRSAGMRVGTKTAGQDKRSHAKQLHEAGYSYGEVGKILGVSRSQAFRLVKGA